MSWTANLNVKAQNRFIKLQTLANYKSADFVSFPTKLSWMTYSLFADSLLSKLSITFRGKLARFNQNLNWIFPNGWENVAAK